MLVPKFTLQNYSQIMTKPFEWNTSGRLALDALLEVMRPWFVKRFASLDARRLWTDLTVPATEKVTMWWKQYSLQEIVIASKLLIPSLRTTDYFFWNEAQGTHTGIDIILPKWTPILSFTSGKVTRIKQRDGVTQNEGNCVVIEDAQWYSRGYEHLERIDVLLWQQLEKNAQIWICGSTGNSTQYHLHFQVDKKSASFHPFWSSDLKTIQQYTIDPLGACRAVTGAFWFSDLPYQTQYQEAMIHLVNLWLLKWFNWMLNPSGWLKRYEMALLFYRVLQKFSLTVGLPIANPSSPSYSDVQWWEQELDKALALLWKYGIMTGSGGKFYPFKELYGEEALAILWRTCFGLKDNSGNDRYAWYMTYFVAYGFIPKNRWYIKKVLPRQEICLLLTRVLEKYE